MAELSTRDAELQGLKRKLEELSSQNAELRLQLDAGLEPPGAGFLDFGAPAVLLRELNALAREEPMFRMKSFKVDGITLVHCCYLTPHFDVKSFLGINGPSSSIM